MSNTPTEPQEPIEPDTEEAPTAVALEIQDVTITTD